MATKKKFSPAQLAAQKLFAERSRAGKLKKNPGLYANINAKRKRIAAGSGEKMRKPGQAGRPTTQAFIDSAKTAKRNPDIRKATIKLAPGQLGTIDGYRASIVRHYDGNMYEIRMPGGLTVQDAKYFIPDNKKRKRNPIIETLIYGLPRGETRDYMEELMYAGGQKLTQAQIDKVFKAASDAGYHSFRVAGFDPTMKPDFAAAVKRKSNPDKAKPRSYVKRVSQATGTAPSKRLIARRKVALTAPAGYFPNPKKMSIEQLYAELVPKKDLITGYQVICMHPKKHVVGVFKTMAQAKQIAVAMANLNNVTYAVKAVKVHKTHFAV